MKQFMSTQQLLRKAMDNQPRESINLKESVVKLIFSKAELEQQKVLSEGLWDTIKGAAGKAADWAATKGHNLTTKVTADKLQSAWKTAGSPTDSEEVAKILQGAGITPDVVAKVYADLKIPAPQPSAPTDQTVPQTDKPTAQSSNSTTSQAGAEPPATPAAEKQSKVGVGQINKVIPTLRVRDLKSIQQTIDTALQTRAQKKQPVAETKYVGFYSKFLNREI